MAYRFLPVFLLNLWLPNPAHAGLSWQQAEDFAQMFHQAVRVGDGGLVLKAYGTMIKRYDRDSQPAIGMKLWSAETGERQDVPTSFWHDRETDEIYVSMGGGSGFTILDPWNERSVTYRNQGIWDTTESPEGELLREDWTFAPYRSPDPGLLFDLPIFFALRRAGTNEILLATSTAGMLLINQGDPATYIDDILDTELWWLNLSSIYSSLYEAGDGTLFADLTHGIGFMQVHSDRRTVTHYRSAGPLFYDGDFNTATAFQLPKSATANWFRPLFKGRNGDLYMGGLNEPPPAGFATGPNTTGTGLTIFQDFDVDLRRYTTSINYRTTGLWNTTEKIGLPRADKSYVDGEATNGDLITDVSRLPGSAVYHGWEDHSGLVYLGTSGGLVLLYPDGQVETIPAFEGWLVYSTFKTPEGDLYLNTNQGIEIWYEDGTFGRLRLEPGSYPPRKVIHPIANSEILPFWLDRAGNLNTAIQGEGIEVYAPNLTGTATSFPVDVSDFAHPRLRWKVPSNQEVELQSRTGSATSAYVNTFDRAVQTSEVLERLGPAFTQQQEGGVLTLTRSKVPFDEVAWLLLPQVFPAGSKVELRVRMRADSQLRMNLEFADSAETRFQTSSVLLRQDEWTVLTTEMDRSFDRLGLFWRYVVGNPLDLDYVVVVSPDGWTPWQSLDKSAGALIPQVNALHPLVQWRVMFERPASGAPLPSLSGVWIEEALVTVVEERVEALPQQTALHANYPNPFNSFTQISYQLSEEGEVSLAVYNLLGQQIRMLEQGYRTAGRYQATWDGGNEGGQAVSSGVYLYRLTSGSFSQANRMLLLK